MNWTDARPTEQGWYVFKHVAYWPLYLVRVKRGDWQLSQNPEWLYASGLPGGLHPDCQSGPLQNVYGQWFGPIPEQQ